MSSNLRGSWNIDTKGVERQGLPPKQDFKEVSLPSSNLGVLITAVSELKTHINSQLTLWKDAIEGPSEIVNTEEEEGENDNEEDEN